MAHLRKEGIACVKTGGEEEVGIGVWDKGSGENLERKNRRNIILSVEREKESDVKQVGSKGPSRSY